MSDDDLGARAYKVHKKLLEMYGRNHRKSGYDPVELFIDPKIRFPMLTIAWFLLKKTLGFKALMEVVSQDASLVKGSHGRLPEDPLDWPVCIAARDASLPAQIASTDVYAQIVRGF